MAALQLLQKELDSLVYHLYKDPATFAKKLYNYQTNNITSEYLTDHICCVNKLNTSYESICHNFIIDQNYDKYLIKIKIDDYNFYYLNVHIYESNLNIVYNSPDNDKLKYLGSDEFTNQLLISSIIRTFYSDQQLYNGIQLIHGASICQEKNSYYGYLLFDHPHYGSFSEFLTLDQFKIDITITDFSSSSRNVKILNPNYIESLLDNVINNLLYLQKICDFRHGELYINNVNITVDPKISPVVPVSRIHNFKKSSLNITNNTDKFRLYNLSPFTQLIFKLNPFSPTLGNQFNDDYYILNNDDVESYIQHMTVPIYSSLDIYTFLVSCLLTPSIYYGIMSQEKLKNKYWNNLWFIDNVSEVWNRIYKFINLNKSHSYTDVLSVIHGIKLKIKLN